MLFLRHIRYLLTYKIIGRCASLVGQEDAMSEVASDANWSSPTLLRNGKLWRASPASLSERLRRSLHAIAVRPRVSPGLRLVNADKPRNGIRSQPTNYTRSNSIYHSLSTAINTAFCLMKHLTRLYCGDYIQIERLISSVNSKLRP